MMADGLLKSRSVDAATCDNFHLPMTNSQLSTANVQDFRRLEVSLE